ncbi:MAG: ABC transporter permease [Acidimicrobiaceae bacterium]|nr:ABC transporter permease [Acidimicrobiaceae bacterium]
MATRTACSAPIPQVERTKVVGLIALPGAMTGLLLAGVDTARSGGDPATGRQLMLGTAALLRDRHGRHGHGGGARWVRPGPGVGEPAAGGR